MLPALVFVTGDTTTRLKEFFKAEPNFAQDRRDDSSNFSFNRILQITYGVVLLRKYTDLKEKVAGVQIWGPGYVITGLGFFAAGQFVVRTVRRKE